MADELLFLTDAWPPQLNGVALTSKLHVDQLGAMGVTTKVVRPDMYRSLPCPGYREIRLALVTPSAIGKIIDEHAPRFVHLNTEGPIGYAGWVACRKRGVPFTTSFRTKFPEYLNLRCGLPVGWTYGVLKRFHNASGACMVPTESLKADLEARGFRNLQIWQRGVDHDLFRPREGADLGFPRPVFLFVGRVAVEKNIQAFLRLDLPGTKVVVGDGPDFAKLSAAYPAARFLGRLPIEALAHAYSAADAFVFPSLTDTFGNVILEALASGLPVAAFPVTGPKDILTDPRIGRLSDDLREAALGALELSSDAARTFSLRYGWKESAGQFLSHLQPIS